MITCVKTLTVHSKGGFVKYSQPPGKPVTKLENSKFKNLSSPSLYMRKNEISWKKFKDLCGQFNLEE